MSQPLPPEPGEPVRGGFGAPIRKPAAAPVEVWTPIPGNPGVETNGKTLRTNMPIFGGKPYTTPTKP